MTMYPSHVPDCIADASHRFNGDASEVHKYYEIVCNCGNRLFNLFISNRKSVEARCDNCGNRILLYDLAYYPAAAKVGGDESFTILKSVVDPPARVFVHYEYGPSEPDMELDRDDVTWCEVFVEAKSGELIRVFDDETA